MGCGPHLVETTHRLQVQPLLGRRKFCSMSQYRSEMTVTVTKSSSKKYGPHTPNSAIAHQTVTRRAMQRTFVKFARVIYRPVPKVLYVYGTTQMEMRLVAKQHKQLHGGRVVELLDTKFGGFPSLSHLVLGLTSIYRDAFRVPGAAFFSHFDRKSQGQRRVSLRNALEIARLMPSPSEHFQAI